MSTDPLSVFVRDQRVVSRTIAGEVILVPTCSDVSDLSAVYVLNEVGAAVWELIDGKRGAGSIAEEVVGEFDAPAEAVTRDVFCFLDSLSEARLIARADTAGP